MPKRKTCLNCRRRKIRCDGQSPTCTQCSGSRGFGDCEYPGAGQTPTQILRERISVLQNRIRELEDPEDSPIALRHPYYPNDIGPFPSSSSGSGSPASARFSRSPVPSMHRATPTIELPEPPVNVMKTMVNHFLSECYRFGFFLNGGRFRESFALPLPIGHHSRPTPSLMNAVYLWSSHLSPSLSAPFEESGFLRSALRHLSKDLSSSHPQRVVQGIQTEVLISYYYLKNGKVLQGNYHANAALAMLLSARLHHIRFPGIPAGGADSTDYARGPALPPPTDGIEKAERINAFWAVLILNNYWVTIQESRYMFYDLADNGADTPWPMDPQDYETPFMPQNSDGTLRQFLGGSSTDGVPELALHAKATVLLAQAISLHTDTKDSILRSGAFASLDQLIDGFRSMLPRHARADAPPPAREALFVTQAVADVAAIRLHLPLAAELDGSRRKYVAAAQAVACAARDGAAAGAVRAHVDPILGILWTSACEALLHAILNGNVAGVETSYLFTALEAILSQMTRLAEHSALMKILVMRLEHNYSNRLRRGTF